MSRRARRWSRRTKLRLAIAATVLGTGVLTLLGLAVQAGRETDQGDPTAGVSARARDDAARDVPVLRFTDIAVEAGLDVVPAPGPRGRTLPEDTGSGLAFGDYDADGDPDLYLVGFPGPLRTDGARVRAEGTGHAYLFRNDGDGHFTDVTAAAGVDNGTRFGMGARFADYDADGDLDLYVTNYGPNRLYRNLGNGRFEDVAPEAGVADPAWSTGATFGDYDRDGNLDLYVCNYVDYDIAGMGQALDVSVAGRGYRVPFALNPNGFDPVPNRLYRNLGDGHFEEVADAVGVANADGRSLAASFCDLDGDGWLDLYVNNDVSANRLFRSVGEMGRPVRMLDLSTITGTADPRGSMGLSMIELGVLGGRPDGLPDVFISHWVAQENALYVSLRTPGGGLEYRDQTRRLGLAERSLDTVGWGSAFLDVDRDGRPDLIVANGSTLEDQTDPSLLVSEPIFLFWNAGDRMLERAAHAGPALATPHGGRGLAVADIDGDGDLDVAVATNRGRPLLLRNDTETANHGLVIEVQGPAASCLGARVEVRVGDAVQVAWVGADASFLSDHDHALLFGLGSAKAADAVRIRFTDGREVRRANVPAGRVVIPHPDA